MVTDWTWTPSYPTGSLQFLRNNQPETVKVLENRVGKSKVRLNVIVVGAGLGGLATSVALARRGHTVTVLEQAVELGEVGAGIQVPSNSSRLLLRWGIGRFLSDQLVEPEGIRFRRWEDGSLIGYTKLVPDFRQHFDGPYYVVHRAHLHDALHRLALEQGVHLRTDSKVTGYDMDVPSVQLSDGLSFTADLIVAADGIKSIARPIILESEDQPPRPSGFAAYRATVDTSKIQMDKETASLLEKPGLNLWIGDGTHVMSYTIAGGKSFNMVLSHRDSTAASHLRREDVLADMKRHYMGWDPKLVNIINMIDKTVKWPLLTGSPLPHWIARSHKLLILGDAAHAMLPYMSQGAAMAVEDGAALGEVLSLIDSVDQLPLALQIFQKERHLRTSQMQEASLLNGKLLHFADGPEQCARDEAMRPEVEGKHFYSSPNQWSDPVTQAWCYGYDAEDAIKKAWRGATGDTKRPQLRGAPHF